MISEEEDLKNLEKAMLHGEESVDKLICRLASEKSSRPNNLLGGGNNQANYMSFNGKYKNYFLDENAKKEKARKSFD